MSSFSVTLPSGPCTRKASTSPRRCRACAFKKTAPGSSNADRSAPSTGRGINAGDSGVATSASSPSTRSATFSPLALNAYVSTSITGLAMATCGCAATRA